MSFDRDYCSLPLLSRENQVRWHAETNMVIYSLCRRLNVFRPKLLKSPLRHPETIKSDGMWRPTCSPAFVILRLFFSLLYHPETSKSDGMQRRWWSSVFKYFETIEVSFSIQRQASPLAQGDPHGHPFFIWFQDYCSLCCYPETIESDSMQRPSWSSTFITFKASRLLLIYLMLPMLFLLTGFADWASGQSSGEIARTKLVSYLYFPFISNKI